MELKKEKNTDWWYALTLLLVLLPSLVINLFSIFWFHQDHKKFKKYETTRETSKLVRGHARRDRFSSKERAVIISFHLVGFGPILRQVYVLRCGLEERRLGKEASLQDVYPHVEGPYCPMPPQRRHHEVLKDKMMDTYSIRKYYERDNAYLGLIESFIQDAPQLMLQIYILAVRHSNTLTRSGIRNPLL